MNNSRTGDDMIHITIDDFYENAASCTRLTREEEIECEKIMKTETIQYEGRMFDL